MIILRNREQIGPSSVTFQTPRGIRSRKSYVRTANGKSARRRQPQPYCAFHIWQEQQQEALEGQPQPQSPCLPHMRTKMPISVHPGPPALPPFSSTITDHPRSSKNKGSTTLLPLFSCHSPFIIHHSSLSIRNKQNTNGFPTGNPRRLASRAIKSGCTKSRCIKSRSTESRCTESRCSRCAKCRCTKSCSRRARPFLHGSFARRRDIPSTRESVHFHVSPSISADFLCQPPIHSSILESSLPPRVRMAFSLSSLLSLVLFLTDILQHRHHRLHRRVSGSTTDRDVFQVSIRGVGA